MSEQSKTQEITTTLPLEQYSQQARQVLEFADEEARRLNHNSIGTEHLLLGLLRESESSAALMLSNFGVDLADVRSAVEAIVGRGNQAVLEEMNLTRRAVVVTELALSEAERLHPQASSEMENWTQVSIAPEHLLIGLISEGEGIAAELLERFGVTLDRVRNEFNPTLDSSGLSMEPTTVKQVARVKNNVVTCHIAGHDLDVIDALVEAGILTTSADAAAWLIHVGIEANKDLLEQIASSVAELRHLRIIAQNLVQQGTAS